MHCRCSFFGLVFLRGCFPLAAKEGTRRGCPLRTPEGGTQWSTRSATKSCAVGLVVYDEAERGEDFRGSRGESVALLLSLPRFRSSIEVTQCSLCALAKSSRQGHITRKH